MDKAWIFYKRQKARGRGALDNLEGRFEIRKRERSEDDWEDQVLQDSYCEKEQIPHQIKTKIYKDAARTIITSNASPDIGMEATINPYRGCEHGCVYCYARPGHEYLGLSAGLDFETKIFIKYNAATMLKKELASGQWVPKTIFLSGVTDCYQPLEKKMKITRQCLEVLRDFKNPVAIITKNHLVTRDVDILAEMAQWQGAYVTISITSLDRHLVRKMEPRASQPHLRLKAIETLAKAGIPVGVMIGPIIPALTDHEIPAILKAAAEAGARSAHYTMIRLPYGVKDHFQAWLSEHFPHRAERVLNHIREIRGGRLYESAFGSRMTGEGVYADQIADLMLLFKKKYRMSKGMPTLSIANFTHDSSNAQLNLF